MRLKALRAVLVQGSAEDQRPRACDMETLDILVLLEASAPCEARLDLAAALAERGRSSVMVAATSREPAIDFAYDYVIGPEAVGQAIEARRTAIDAAMASTQAAYRAYASVTRGDWRWEPMTPGISAEQVALKARWFDLVILRRPEAGDHFGRAVAETAALASGTTCLLVPEPVAKALRTDHVVLAWNGSREAKRALDAGLGFLKRASQVTVAMTSEIPAERLGETDLLRHLTRHGIAAEPHHVAADHGGAGPALLEVCASLDADLLVMGAYGHSRAAELVLGGATRTVLAEARLPVLMAH